MWKLFKQDAQRWVVPQQISDPKLITPLMILKLLWRYIPLRAMLVYRFGEWANRNRIPLIPGLAYRFNYKRYGLEIANYNNIKGGLYIAHVAGTVLMPESIGENCTVVAGVTVGLRDGYAFPRIGDNVFIGAGARILGDIDVGDGAMIGANAVVIKDVPAVGTAVGVPAKVIKINNEKVQKVQKEPVIQNPIPQPLPIKSGHVNGHLQLKNDPAQPSSGHTVIDEQGEFEKEFLELHDLLMKPNKKDRRPMA